MWVGGWQGQGLSPPAAPDPGPLSASDWASVLMRCCDSLCSAAQAFQENEEKRSKKERSGDKEGTCALAPMPGTLTFCPEQAPQRARICGGVGAVPFHRVQPPPMCPCCATCSSIL